MKTLNIDQRYLFSRPRGGLNDMLVQIEKSRQYAIKYDRILILDTARSGLRRPFDKVFVTNENFGCELIIWTKKIARDMNRFQTVIPTELIGLVSSYKAKWSNVTHDHVIRDTKVSIGFDHSRDHSAQLLVHDQAGGGTSSIDLLRCLSLRPNVVDQVAKRLIPLGRDYDAIHIRNTDYESNYETFFQSCKSKFVGRSLLVCSDSAVVKVSARTLLDPSTKILSVANIPNLAGRPIHLNHKFDPHKAAIDLLSDLIAMARSRTFMFAELTKKNEYTPKASGFSLLADNLKKRPDIIRELFRYMPHEDYQILFADNPSG